MEIWCEKERGNDEWIILLDGVHETERVFVDSVGVVLSPHREKHNFIGSGKFSFDVRFKPGVDFVLHKERIVFRSVTGVNHLEDFAETIPHLLVTGQEGFLSDRQYVAAWDDVDELEVFQ